MNALIFGEILWDVFPDHRTIGGAPLNFGAHLHRLGCDVTLISAVGRDALGEESQSAIEALGLSSSCVATLDYPTGQAVVTLDETGVPSYELVQDVAYDHIPFPDHLPCSGSFDAIYFGTLAQRASDSRSSLQRLVSTIHAKTVFCDINIRQHFYSDETLRFCLESATVLKISRDEMGVLAELGVLEQPLTNTASDARSIGLALRRRFPQLEQLLLTLDAVGAAVWEAETDTLSISDKPDVAVLSTVGGGDSFGACYLRHYLAGEPASVCLRRAVTLSNFVVTQLGAIPDYPPALCDALGLEDVAHGHH